jgi:hypothetical protein
MQTPQAQQMFGNDTESEESSAELGLDAFFHVLEAVAEAAE